MQGKGREDRFCYVIFLKQKATEDGYELVPGEGEGGGFKKIASPSWLEKKDFGGVFIGTGLSHDIIKSGNGEKEAHFLFRQRKKLAYQPFLLMRKRTETTYLTAFPS